MDRTGFQTILKDLPRLHERPRGGILIATVNDPPAGCVIYSETGPGLAEFNCIFVGQNGREHRLGRAMLNHMCAQMTADR